MMGTTKKDELPFAGSEPYSKTNRDRVRRKNAQGGQELQYAFDMDLAQKYGVPEAIFVHRLQHWVRENALNDRNYRDGHYWTYDTMNALMKIFPWWTRRQLQGIIARCKEKGLLLTAEYNEDRRDRTTWYTVTEAVIVAYEPWKIGAPESCNAMHETVQCNVPNGAAQCTKSCTLYKEHLEDHLEDEREGAHTQEKPVEATGDERRGYGEFGNVRLTEGELARLTTRWTPDQVAAEIEALSAYMQSDGKRYRDHYAALIRWLKKDCPPAQPAGRVLIDED